MAPITPRKSSGSNGPFHSVNKIGRKKLQTLQVSANDRSILVGGQRLGLISSPNKKFSIFHDSEMKSSQENSTPEIKSAKPRRSQRKRQAVTPSISKENDQKPDSKKGGITLAKPSKKSSKTSTKVASKKTKELRQRKIMFCCLSKQTVSSSGSDPESTMELKPETISESPKVIYSSSKKAELPEIVLSHIPSSDVPPESPQHDVAPEEMKISEEFRYLIMDTDPPESYWKDIAEQRSAALEEALRENSRLHDEIEVLQVENEHLLSVVEAAKELAVFAQQYVNDADAGDNQL